MFTKQSWHELRHKFSIEGYSLYWCAKVDTLLLLTLKIRCINILSPSFPGYFPARFAGERSNKLAPVSLQMAWTSIFFPEPLGPASRMDLVRGACSWTAGEPDRFMGKFDKKNRNKILFTFSFPKQILMLTKVNVE